jgi:hypothetical protein
VKAGAAVPVLILGLVAASLAAGAQQARKVYRVGVLLYGDPRAPSASLATFFNPFRESLRERGWAEGQNVTFEVRNALGNLKRRKLWRPSWSTSTWMSSLR